MTRLAPALLLALAFVAAPFVLACAPPPPLAGDLPRTSMPVGPADANLSITNGRLWGSMGSVRSFDAPASRLSGQYIGTTSSWVRLDSEGTNWWAMTALQLDGDLMGADYAPGVHRTYLSGVVQGEPSAPHVDVMGCSGPQYGNYTFDAHSSQVDVRVTGTNAQRHLEYQVEFDGQSVHGAFDYRRAPTGI